MHKKYSVWHKFVCDLKESYLNVRKSGKTEQKYIYRFWCGAALTAFCAASFFFVWFGFVRENNQTGHLLGRGNLLMAAGIYVIVFILCGRWLGAFLIGISRRMNLIASEITAIFLTDFTEIFISMAITGQFRFFHHFLGRYALLFLFQSAVASVLTIPVLKWYGRKFPPLQVLELYGENRERLNLEFEGRSKNFEVVRRIDCTDKKQTGKQDDDKRQADKKDRIGLLRKELSRYDAVLLNGLQDSQRDEILKICYEADKRVYFTPTISDILVKASGNFNVFDTPLYLNRNLPMTFSQRFWKRFFDIVLSLVSLCILSPLFLGISIAIKVNDKGPVFYRQTRCTLGGKEFQILKFRSMVVDAETDGKSHPAIDNDGRITKVGKVLRATRMDELPQLINILKGDMSIVGPRPERVEHVRRYTEELPEFRYRLKVKGGLTGYAQVYGKYNTTALDKLKMDLVYITNYSLLLDVQIMFETVKVLFQKDSTEGFSEEQREDLL